MDWFQSVAIVTFSPWCWERLCNLTQKGEAVTLSHYLVIFTFAKLFRSAQERLSLIPRGITCVTVAYLIPFSPWSPPIVTVSWSCYILFTPEYRSIPGLWTFTLRVNDLLISLTTLSKNRFPTNKEVIEKYVKCISDISIITTEMKWSWQHSKRKKSNVLEGLMTPLCFSALRFSRPYGHVRSSRWNFLRSVLSVRGRTYTSRSACLVRRDVISTAFFVSLHFRMNGMDATVCKPEAGHTEQSERNENLSYPHHPLRHFLHPIWAFHHHSL